MFLWRFSMFFTIFVHPSIKWSACCSLARSSAGSSASAFVTSSADETWSDFEIDCIAVRCAARLENLRIQNSYGDGENLRPSSMTQGNWWEMMLDDGTGSEFFFCKICKSPANQRKNKNMKEKLCANHFPHGNNIDFYTCSAPLES